MKLEVTQGHIDNGVPANALKCPVALALLEAGFKTVSVWRRMTVTNGEEQSINSPKDLLEFAKAFDRGDHCVPTVFDIPELNAPDAPAGALASGGA